MNLNNNSITPAINTHQIKNFCFLLMTNPFFYYINKHYKFNDIIFKNKQFLVKVTI